MRLWGHRDFLKLWTGQTISLLGTQVTGLALALTAAIVLQATPAEMGLIGTLNVLPFVLFGFPAGVWVDRVQRRWVLIGTDVARAGLLATVPIAAVAGRLNIPQLYVVSFGMGSLSVLFRVAYASYLPSLVNQADLADGNAKLALAEAIARVGGPGIAGVLVQVLTALIAILVDCISYLFSAGHCSASPPGSGQHAPLEQTISAVRSDRDCERSSDTISFGHCSLVPRWAMPRIESPSRVELWCCF